MRYCRGWERKLPRCRVTAVTAVNIRKSSGRTEYQRGILAMDASWYDLPPRPGFRHTALDGGIELHDRAEARSWRRDLV